MFEMKHKKLALWALCIGMLPPQLTAAEAPLPVSAAACEVRMWDSASFSSEAPSNYGSYGLIGAAAQSWHDKRFPQGSTENLLSFELRREAMEPQLLSASWGNITKASRHQIFFADQIFTKEEMKTLRTSKSRNSNSTNPCYLEVYVERHVFLGGFVQSNLMTTFTFRSFSSGAVREAHGKQFHKTKGFPAKEEALVEAGGKSIRDAYADNLQDFIASKAPKLR